MTDNKQVTLVDAFLLSVNTATWITESDAAVVRFGAEIAHQLDVLKDAGEVEGFTVLAPKYTAILQQLHLTPETRTQGKQHDETTGTDYANAFIRLVTTETDGATSSGQKRRASSKPTSGRPRATPTTVAKNRP